MKKILLISVLGAALFSSMQSYAASAAEYALILAITSITGDEPQDLRVTESRATYYYSVTYTDQRGNSQSADCVGAGDTDNDGYPPDLEISCTITTPTR